MTRAETGVAISDPLERLAVQLAGRVGRRVEGLAAPLLGFVQPALSLSAESGGQITGPGR